MRIEAIFPEAVRITEIIASNDKVSRSVDKVGKKRTLKGIRLGEILD